MLNVYVSNFPSHLTVRELTNICGKKGNIVDVYIAKHKNKFGQSFGFCRYSGIDNTENLIDSLNKVWIGKICLHANIARFDRNKGFAHKLTSVKSTAPVTKKPEPVTSTSVMRDVSNSHSFVNVVKGDPSGVKLGNGCEHVEDSPVITVSQDNYGLELTLLGCHKDFRSIANSKIICNNEGFTGVDVKYLGGLWVMFIFEDMHVRNSFLKHDGIMSWFSTLEPWHDDFVLKERLVWLEIEGVPFRAWNNDTFKCICKKWGEVLFIDDTDFSNRFSIWLCIKTTHTSLIFSSSLVTLKGVTYAFRVRELCSWIPSFATEDVESDEEGFADKSINSASDKDVEEEEESVAEPVGADSLAAKDNVQPCNSDPFELESLIAKNGNYHSCNQDSETPKFPPGFTQSDNGDNNNEFSDACKCTKLIHLRLHNIL